MSSLALMENCKLSPYWWEKTPRPASQEKALPSSVDVLVIGAGYTGLHAALQTARGGRSTWVIDAEDGVAVHEMAGKFQPVSSPPMTLLQNSMVRKKPLTF